MTMTTVLGGLMNTSAVIGSGQHFSGVSTFGGSIPEIDLMNGYYVTTLAKDGTITSISANFMVSSDQALLLSNVAIFAQVYIAYPGEDIFHVVPDAYTILYPTLSGIVSVGETISGTTTGLSIPVIQGSKLIVVFSAGVFSGLDAALTITGVGSASVLID